jgi:hypothetical protein
VAVADGAALGIVAALLAHDLDDLLLHQLGQHPEPDAHRQGHEALLGGAHQLPEGLLHARRQRALRARDGLLGR